MTNIKTDIAAQYSIIKIAEEKILSLRETCPHDIWYPAINERYSGSNFCSACDYDLGKIYTLSSMISSIVSEEDKLLFTDKVKILDWFNDGLPVEIIKDRLVNHFSLYPDNAIITKYINSF